jgi:hypothetical protein
LKQLPEKCRAIAPQFCLLIISALLSQREIRRVCFLKRKKPQRIVSGPQEAPIKKWPSRLRLIEERLQSGFHAPHRAAYLLVRVFCPIARLNYRTAGVALISHFLSLMNCYKEDCPWSQYMCFDINIRNQVLVSQLEPVGKVVVPTCSAEGPGSCT